MVAGNSNAGLPAAKTHAFPMLLPASLRNLRLLRRGVSPSDTLRSGTRTSDGSADRCPGHEKSVKDPKDTQDERLIISS